MKQITPIHVPDTLQVESRTKIVVTGIVIILLFFGGFGTWSVLAKTSGAVMANGTIRVDLNRKTIQHRDGGIVNEILVRDGDVVTIDQPMVALKDSNIESSVDMLSSQVYLWQAKMARLEAQRSLLPDLEWPSGMVPPQTEEQKEILKSEERLFHSERQNIEGQVGLMNAQIEQIQQQILGLDAQVAAEEEIIAAFEEELEAKKALEEARYLDKTPILDLRRNLADHKARKSLAIQNTAQARERISELKLRISELRKEYVQQANAQHAEYQARMFETQDRLRPLRDAKERLVVRAPVAGTVMGMSVFTIGAVVRPGDRLMDIVPQENKLIVEAQVQTHDIAKIHIGQETRIQLSAYNQREVQPVTGTLVYISPDIMTIRTPYGEMPVYQVHIQIEQSELDKQNLVLSPGMPAAVFITTKQRSVIEYMLEPLTINFRKAMRESS